LGCCLRRRQPDRLYQLLTGIAGPQQQSRDKGQSCRNTKRAGVEKAPARLRRPNLNIACGLQLTELVLFPDGLLQLVGLGLCILFPWLVLALPNAVLG